MVASTRVHLRRFGWLVPLITLAAVAACGGGDDDDGDDDDDVPALDSGSDATVHDSGQGDAGSDAQAFDAGTNFTDSALLINEISGGDEWVELVNSGTSSFDVSGFKLADRNKDTGQPKLDEAATFPAGTVLAPGAYLMVRGGGVGEDAKPCPEPLTDAGANDAQAGDAATDDGGVGAPTRCFNAEWGISNKAGETLFLIDPSGTVVGQVVYPANASQGAFSYARVPNADPQAGFVTALETPFAPNVAP